MGHRYSQLTIEDRCEVARRHAAGASRRQIAAALDRAPSTIARELRRNASRTQGYQPRYADQQAHARRWRGSRLDRDPTLRAQVLPRLQQGWSPEQVAGRLAREAGHPVISHESIYRFIDAQIRRTKDYAWRHFLPRGKTKRGWRGRRGGSPASSRPCRPPGARRSPSTTAPSSPAITSSTPTASRPFSATPTPPGRRAASRTPLGGCAAPCPANPTWQPSRRPASRSSSRPTTTRRANASATEPRPRSSGIHCCT